MNLGSLLVIEPHQRRQMVIVLKTKHSVNKIIKQEMYWIWNIMGTTGY